MLLQRGRAYGSRCGQRAAFGGRCGRMPGPFRRYEKELKNLSFVYVRVGEKEKKKKKRTLGCGGTCVNSERFKAAQGCQRKAFIWNK